VVSTPTKRWLATALGTDRVRGDRKGEGREGTKEGRQGGDVEGLLAKFHVNVFTVSAAGGQKHNFGQILIFWGSCTNALLPIKVEFGAL